MKYIPKLLTIICFAVTANTNQTNAAIVKIYTGNYYHTNSSSPGYKPDYNILFDKLFNRTKLNTKNNPFVLDTSVVHISGAPEFITSYKTFVPPVTFPLVTGNFSVHVGSKTSTDQLSILGVAEIATGSNGANGVNSEMYYTAVANVTQRIRGGKFVALVNPAGFTFNNTGSGALGLEGVARITGAGTVTTASGGYSRVLIDAATCGIVTNANGYAFVTNFSGTGIITNSIGGNFYNQVHDGSTNSFNILIGTALSAGSVGPSDGATGAWSIYNYAVQPNYFAGKLGIGIGGGSGAPHITAWLQLKAGSATAGTAPLKFTSGLLLSTPEIGAIEFLTDKLYTTITTSAARKELALNDVALTPNTVPYATTNGRLTPSTVTNTELSYLSGVTTAIQTQLNTKAPVASPSFTTKISTPHIAGSSATPVITAGDGAGTLATVSITGSDLAGEITITTGTSPTAASTLATITFSSPYSSAPFIVLQRSSPVAPADMELDVRSTTNFTITGTLTASTTYKYNYIVAQ